MHRYYVHFDRFLIVVYIHVTTMQNKTYSIFITPGLINPFIFSTNLLFLSHT